MWDCRSPIEGSARVGCSVHAVGIPKGRAVGPAILVTPPSFDVRHAILNENVTRSEALLRSLFVGFVLGKVNVKQHQELIEKSKNKYSKQVITKDELRI